MQQHLFFCHLTELYREFKVKNPEIRIGFSSFACLRPKCCAAIVASRTNSLCVVFIHQNAILLLVHQD